MSTSNYKGVDYYFIDDMLTDEEKAIRDTVRDFTANEILPVIEKFNQDMKFPFQIIPKMAELGVFGPTLPVEYGGMGINNIAYGLIMQELERGDSGVRSFASVQSALVMYPIFTFGSEEQKKFWLPKLASAEKIGCFGLTEPDFGSNPGSMITRAEKLTAVISSTELKCGLQTERLPMLQSSGLSSTEKSAVFSWKKGRRDLLHPKQRESFLFGHQLHPNLFLKIASYPKQIYCQRAAA
jgi:hypothetical protein